MANDGGSLTVTAAAATVAPPTYSHIHLRLHTFPLQHCTAGAALTAIDSVSAADALILSLENVPAIVHAAFQGPATTAAAAVVAIAAGDAAAAGKIVLVVRDRDDGGFIVAAAHGVTPQVGEKRGRRGSRHDGCLLCCCW